MPKPLTAHKSPPLKGQVRVPGDKSISHRSLILGALGLGLTEIKGLLESEDVLATASALEAMGVPIARDEERWRVTGCGIGGLRQPSGEIDFGNTGTGVRLMMGVIAGNDIEVRMIGDASLSKRPMGRVLAPLKRMGAEVLEIDKTTLPLTLKGSSELVPIRYELPVASAQVKSAVLLAGLHTLGATSVIEDKATRDHTERMLRHFGCDVEVSEVLGGQCVTVQGEAKLCGATVVVPGDPSSAAFLVAAALIVPSSDILIEGILINPTRTGFFDTVQDMGGDLALLNPREMGGEPVADILVRSSQLRGVVVPSQRAPRMIDEYPVLAGLAAFAEGETRMEGLAELRVKESDRLAATAAGLTNVGVACRVEGDTLSVTGNSLVPGGGAVASEMDHRIAMAFLTMGLASERSITIDDGTMIATSFPEFVSLVQMLGGRIAAGANG